MVSGGNSFMMSLRANVGSDWMIVANCQTGLGCKLEAFVGKINV
jgi:hypothetical protein